MLKKIVLKKIDLDQFHDCKVESIVYSKGQFILNFNLEGLDILDSNGTLVYPYKIIQIKYILKQEEYWLQHYNVVKIKNPYKKLVRNYAKMKTIDQFVKWFEKNSKKVKYFRIDEQFVNSNSCLIVLYTDKELFVEIYLGVNEIIQEYKE